MNNVTTKNLRWIFTAVVLLSFGFILGTLRVDVLTFAQNDSAQYQGPSVAQEKPEKALQVAQQLERAFSYAARRAQPAVVTVYTQKEVQIGGARSPFGPRSPFDRFFEDMFPEREDRSREVTGLGSGVIIRSNGYILTNYHVIKDVDEISIKLQNDERIQAELVGSDPKTDLAVIKIDRSDLPTADFADSSKVKVGQWAIAIGSPFHLQNSVSIGHVSATHRSIEAMPGQNSIQYQDFIQTDAAINQGNSGGPLVDIEGNIIGINTMIQSTSGGNQGIGFAVSSDLASRTASDIIEYGHVKRPWLGVAIQELDPDVREEHFGEQSGVIVSEVIGGSPADEAGIQQGDLITHFNGETVESPLELQQSVLAQSIGDDVTITIKREGEQMELSTELAELPDQPGTPQTSETDTTEPTMLNKLGLNLSVVSSDESSEYGLRRDHPVFVVEGVQSGSPAAGIGLRRGHVIISADRRAFDSVETLNDYLAEKSESGASSVLLLVKQEDSFFYKALPLPN